MGLDRTPLIIPSETQVREFDAKLLLAAVAAERGFPSVIGSRTEIHLDITRMPRGIYVANNVRRSSERMFRIMDKLGFAIVAWDEEGLVTYSPEQYCKQRISAKAMAKAVHLFAWGQEHASVLERLPPPSGTRVHATGNPRVDIMRPELLFLFREEAEAIAKRLGRFLLINTNFSSLNHFFPNLTSMVVPEGVEASVDAGDFDAGLAVHRHTIFLAFRKLIPALARAFPETTLVVRPHPAENPEIWKQAAAGCANVRVVHEGNVIPWLLASAALIHNGCTTAVEAFVLRRPAVAYQPVKNPRFDTYLPNALSYSVSAFEPLRDLVDGIVRGEVGPCDAAEHWACAQHHISALTGPWASERIADVLEALDDGVRSRRGPGPGRYATGWVEAKLRARSKRANARKPGHKNHVAYQRQRFPGITLSEVRSRLERMKKSLGRFEDVTVNQLQENVFRVAP
ncbi:MAG: hypothetical protein Kow0092_17100 [Deferrisomatales bacterium]